MVGKWGIGGKFRKGACALHVENMVCCCVLTYGYTTVDSKTNLTVQSFGAVYVKPTDLQFLY